ncbi:type II toxin-antitoxin system VapC family toxin [uncultured Sphaerotilus sp.]|uniref:type II toxin-antitoxin system VapC family toxin n=1 Tax=uncultured Sphaerotilus sp. TaxID=474984 RepID=UPI0030CA3027
MRLLLDTHIALWSVYEPDRLPRRAHALLTAPDVEAFVSVATLWEIAIKNSKHPGLLPPVAVARADFAEAGFREFPITGEVMAQVELLQTDIHGDPFDRLLIATAFSEPMHLVTHDRKVGAYDPAMRLILLC